ncbi:MAG: interleukin-like EMT inducer domain-containing protein [Anaerolineae bacterium]
MVALAGFLLLSLLLTWPLILHGTTHVPGDGIDDPALAWNLWWVKFAAVDRQLNLFDCRWMFYPIGINLAFYTLTVLNGLLSVPLQTAASVIVANNALILASFVLSGYGAFLLARTVLRRPQADFWPAFGAGIVYAFASSKLFYVALGQANIASSQWIPFCALYLVRLGRAVTLRQALREGALAGLFLALQLWAEMTFASFLFILVGLFSIRWLITALISPRRAGLTPRLLGLAAMAVVVALAALPLLAAMLPDLQAEGDFFSRGGGFADLFSADLAGFAQPTQLHPLLGAAARAAPFPHDKGQHLYPGFSVLALALLGAWAGRGRGDGRFWTLAALAFFLLALGPTLRIAGQDTGIPGPFALLARLPFFNGNRYPSRFSVMLMLSLAVLAAEGLAVLAGHSREIFRKRSAQADLAAERPCAPNSFGGRPFSAPAGSALAAVSLLLILFEHLSVPLPLNNLAQVPAVYQDVAATPGDFTLLELPLGWRNGARVLGKQDPLIMQQQWYQTLHHKRLLGGNTSRNPALKFQYFSQAPVLSTLLALTNAADQPPHERLRSLLADPTAWQQLLEHDRRAAPDVLRQFDIRLITIHEAAAPPNLITYVESVLPVRLLTVREGIRLYAVTDIAAPSPTDVDLTAAAGTLYLGEGWNGWLQPPVLGGVWHGETPDAVWAERTQSRLLLPLAETGARLTLEAKAAGPGQTLRVRVNGWRSPVQALAPTWQMVTVEIPARAVSAGLNDVILEFGKLYPLPLESDETWAIGATGQRAPVPIFVESAGEESGDFAHIWVNGRDVVTTPAEPGYVVAVIEPLQRTVEAVRRFDTLADPTASSALAAFIQGLPAGRIVAVAAADEASLALGADAVAALRDIGAAGDLMGHFRWGHAIIGVAGAAPGQALEALGALQPVGAAVGGAWRSPQVAAAVRRVGWLAP